MNDLEERQIETAKHAARADMRGHINAVGIRTAAAIAADRYAAPGNLQEHARIQGIILAAYEAGQLDGMTNKERVS